MVHYCFVEWIENWGEKDIPKPQNLIFRICRKGGVNKYLRMKTELVQMWCLWWSHTSLTMLVMVSLMTTRWSENCVVYQIAYQTKITNHETLVHGCSQGVARNRETKKLLAACRHSSLIAVRYSLLARARTLKSIKNCHPGVLISTVNPAFTRKPDFLQTTWHMCETAHIIITLLLWFWFISFTV